MVKTLNNLGGYLKALRKASSLPLRAVEKQTGISNAFISQLESGQVKQPSPIMLYKLAELYGVPYEDLMERAGYPIPGASRSSDQAIGGTLSQFGRLSKHEEETLLDYLAFIRSHNKGGQKS